ncbi:MAG: hypothetical protein ACM32E_19320 [Gemmatimonadota bacterium]
MGAVPGSGAEGLAEKLGELAGPAAEPENEVLLDDARIVRWAGPAFALFSLVMVPWTVYLAYSLPTRQVSADYDVAWAGFDVLLIGALAMTGFFALRRSRYLAATASAAAALLVVDAWFDVVTSPPGQRAGALVLAVLVELPLAAVCGWLSYHTEQLAERRIVILLRLTRRRRGRARGRAGSAAGR